MNLDILHNQPFCMRKNSSFKALVYDDLITLFSLVCIYSIAYSLDYTILCLVSLLGIDYMVFHLGTLYGYQSTKTIHLNQFDELDTELSQDHELSQRQIEQNATLSRSMTAAQEYMVNKKLNRVAYEAALRNNKKNDTPSVTDEIDDDLPPLIPIYDVNGYKHSINHYVNAID